MTQINMRTIRMIRWKKNKNDQRNTPEIHRVCHSSKKKWTQRKRIWHLIARFHRRAGRGTHPSREKNHRVQTEATKITSKKVQKRKNKSSSLNNRCIRKTHNIDKNLSKILPWQNHQLLPNLLQTLTNQGMIKTSI